MYGKIFQTLFTGSLYGRFEATVTHIACIVLSDREGYLNYTPEALAGATGFPLDVIRKGLEELQQPDDNSRSKEHEGRRIIPIEPGSPNGWFVVNKASYREMQDPDSIREQTRERVRKFRAKRSVTDGNGPLLHTDTDSNPDIDSKKDIRDAKASALRILEFLNTKAKRAYKPVSANLDFILARLKEGATEQDMKSVIARKVRDWGADPKMAQYLRPATLFNKTKFAQYQGELVETEEE